MLINIAAVFVMRKNNLLRYFFLYLVRCTVCVRAIKLMTIIFVYYCCSIALKLHFVVSI